jgi:hypothetical protein
MDLLSSGSAWSTVPGQPGLHRETLSQRGGGRGGGGSCPVISSGTCPGLSLCSL